MKSEWVRRWRVKTWSYQMGTVLGWHQWSMGVAGYKCLLFFPYETPLIALQRLIAGQFSHSRWSEWPFSCLLSPPSCSACCDAEMRWHHPSRKHSSKGASSGRLVSDSLLHSPHWAHEKCASLSSYYLRAAESHWDPLSSITCSKHFPVFHEWARYQSLFPQITKWHMSSDLEAVYPLLLGLSRKKEGLPPFPYEIGKEKNYSTLAAFSLNPTER